MLVFLHDFGAQTDNVSHQSVIVLFRKALDFHARVDNEFQHLFLLLGVGDLLLEKSQTITCSVL